MNFMAFRIKDGVTLFATHKNYHVTLFINNQILNVQNDLGPKIAESVRDLILEYNDIFCLPEDPLPCVREKGSYSGIT